MGKQVSTGEEVWEAWVCPGGLGAGFRLPGEHVRRGWGRKAAGVEREGPRE